MKSKYIDECKKLQELYLKQKDNGFVILGFICHDIEEKDEEDSDDEKDKKFPFKKLTKKKKKEEPANN